MLSLIAVSILALAPNFAVAQEAPHSEHGYVGRTDTGYAIAMPYTGGWLVVTQDGIGNVRGDLPGEEAAHAAAALMAGSPTPATTPLMQCVAAAIAACQAQGGGEYWGICSLHCGGEGQFTVTCRDAHGQCPPAVGAFAPTLYVTTD